MPNVNDKPLVTITIEGPLGTAKTSIAAAIAEVLRGAGFECGFDAGESDVLFFNYLDVRRSALDHLRKLHYKPYVAIREVHLNRAGKRIG